MTSILKALQSGQAAPKVLLLPDAVFFTRTVTLAAGSSPTDVAAQVELALETLSPFPPAQLYHGYYWVPASERALVFAAYRRRFTSEQLEGWDAAELVIPSFAALLSADVQAGTTMIVPSEEGLTAIYWDSAKVPLRVTFRAVPAGSDDAAIVKIREELLAASPSSRPLILASSPQPLPGSSDREFSFRAEGLYTKVPAERASAMDVRDKEALAGLRRARARDVGLWRVFVGMILLLVLVGLGELGLVGLKLWQQTLTTRANAQRPIVERVMTAQSIATRINELSSKRLLPFEMISAVNEKRPDDIYFVRVQTNGLAGLLIDATSNSPSLVSSYQAALSALPSVERVEFRNQQVRENSMTFTMAITFKSDALKPTAANP
jgi:hypothetical protein